jgi:predicted NBD/HSP70 family sugar kinase
VEPLTQPSAARHRPGLDPGFLPASLWEQDYRRAICRRNDRRPLAIACVRPDGSGSVVRSEVCVTSPADLDAACRHAERRLKFLLWSRGGCMIHIEGPAEIAARLRAEYGGSGARAFDHVFFRNIHGRPLEVVPCGPGELPSPVEDGVAHGRHLDGCRIGFDLGGSDRKCAAVIDGHVVFSDETPWNPYFEKDPAYHLSGIENSLRQAAAHLPRVDAIGGSAAGIYVDNEVRAASLFRGVPPAVFDEKVRPMFLRLRDQWKVPFEIANDGDVAALAGSMALGKNAVLGVSMGTSLAAGYVSPSGTLTPRLSELAFAPVDYRESAPVDEWSGDRGCGVQYFSQQAVARLAPVAGIRFADDIPLAERLAIIQDMQLAGDERAERIFETIGIYLGYALPHWAAFYTFHHVLLLGRVTSGAGGTVILEAARRVLADEFPALAPQISITTPDERGKRHGQAVAAASLPSLAK